MYMCMMYYFVRFHCRNVLLLLLLLSTYADVLKSDRQ